MTIIQLTQDFKEFLQLLNDHEVEYLVVGGYAVNFYGYVRTTGDMDIWVAIHSENAKKLVTVLRAFGLSAKNVREEMFLDAKKVFQLGIPPFRIDILMSLSGIDFTSCYAKRTVDSVDGVTVHMLSFEDLKTNKKASGRTKDLGDLDYFSRKSDKQQ
jgi:hypothetical protein